MTNWAERTFYMLSSVAIGAALFVMTPSNNSDVSRFQSEAKQQFAAASVQVFGDQPVFDAPLFVIQSINEFYQQSADAMIAMLTPVGNEQDQINTMAINAYEGLKIALNPNTYTSAAKFALLNRNNEPEVLGAETSDENDIVIPANFMQEEPIYSIAPESWAPPTPPAAPLDNTYPADSMAVWNNVTDGSTGQVYCVAIFNTEVNRYMGPCKFDYR